MVGGLRLSSCLVSEFNARRVELKSPSSTSAMLLFIVRIGTADLVRGGANSSHNDNNSYNFGAQYLSPVPPQFVRSSLARVQVGIALLID